jgi:hypothetical protein
MSVQVTISARRSQIALGMAGRKFQLLHGRHEPGKDGRRFVTVPNVPALTLA